MGVGIADKAANKLGNTLRTIAGIGTSQALGALITVNSANLTTTGGATAFTLPTTWEIGDDVTVFNTSATTALLYPQSGGAINGGSTDASVSLAQNTAMTLNKRSATSWRATASTIGSGTTFTDITVDSITGTDASLGITGLASTQGGAVALVGGASSTSANAGGAITMVGGAGGLTGAGGAVTATGAAGGATSGLGGAVAFTGGAGTAGNSAGGAASLTGGAGQGTQAGGLSKIVGGAGGATGAGGAAQVTAGAGGATSGTGGAVTLLAGAGTNGNAVGGALTATAGAGNGTGAGGAITVTGGASGAGATGNGGVITVVGGASLASNGSGGSVVLAPAAKAGTGIAGAMRCTAVAFFTQSAPAAKTTTVTLTAAEILGGLITANQGAAGAATYTLPLGTDIEAAMPADTANGDTFTFSIINISTNAAEIVTVQGNTGTTAVGNMTIAANGATTSQAWGTFAVRRTGSGAYSFYRIG